MSDPLAAISAVESGQLLTCEQFLKLCNKCIELFMEEPNCCSVSAPVWICGDLHGQFYDLLKIFLITERPDAKFVFLGDYVDRGRHSVLTLTYLLLLKLKYPSKIFLLRGNHECRQITQVYGFYGTFGVDHLLRRMYALLRVSGGLEKSVRSL